MAKSRIIPSRTVTNRPIGGSAISPSENISGTMNDQKVIVDGRQYDGGESNTAAIYVDNDNHIIYAEVRKTPGTLEFTLPDNTTLEYDGSQGITRIKLDAYSIDELIPQEGELKRYRLLKNGETQVGDTIIIPKDVDLQTALNNEVQDRLAVEAELRGIIATKENATTYAVEDKSIFDNFVFEDNKEVTCNEAVNTDITLNIRSDVAQGFISLLTIAYMPTLKTITINNQSDYYTLRIVNGIVVQSGNTFVTTTSGKKLIFARCDGVDIEVLIIEETE